MHNTDHLRALAETAQKYASDPPVQVEQAAQPAPSGGQEPPIQWEYYRMEGIGTVRRRKAQP